MKEDKGMATTLDLKAAALKQTQTIQIFKAAALKQTQTIQIFKAATLKC
ncbi:hypothetical protein TIFTF001_028090 [Ficus carica]|uniref:Uncharacterized protein n=1 Tax=Ficus carica TaxID=3494 RepID=A0AA88DP77_FICCA|nr:hypothetical protein TIFTF001_028090 [Ficus carica]